MGTIVEDVRARIEEARGKLKTRIDEWRERGWRRPEGSSSSSNPRFPVLKEIREKGVASALRARREKRIARLGGKIPRGPEEVIPEIREAPRVPAAKEIRPTVGRREIAIEL